VQLRICLLSDTTFGRGDGIAGVVDSEVEHDAATGMPFVKGRTVKGILVESCADILYALRISQSSLVPTFEAAARRLFGQPGSTLADTGSLHIGSARLAENLRLRIQRSNYTPSQILEALTTVRHQTAVNTGTDRPLDNSLRTTRVVLRNTVFYAPIVYKPDTTRDGWDETVDLALLAACAAGMRRAGQSRTRGRGRIDVRLEGTDRNYLDVFADYVAGE
jgi:CRISPR/Cas system CSM-associated protein Csm3 (group 7 of RAMP superfamily)